jgi:hypothetical protein
MRRLLSALATLGIAVSPALAVSNYITPDVPTDDPAAGAPIYLPWEIVRNDSAIYSMWQALPAGTPIDALHHMCIGNWLISVEVPTDLGGTTHDPRDVVEFDPAGGSYTPIFCGGPVGIPAGTNVDAAFLDGGDAAPLILSFDVPTDLTGMGGGIYDPSDLVMFNKTGPGCGGWTLGGLHFDASAAVPPVPTTTNLSGADRQWAGFDIMTFDVPTTLGAPTYLPGELVSWDPGLPAFASFFLDLSWPLTSRADSMSLLADPGRVPPTIQVTKSMTPGNIVISWAPATSVGGEDYGIYEGTVPSYSSHGSITCTDALADLMEDITPAPGDTYYLVVPLNPNNEGSYGTDHIGVERPQGFAPCGPQALGCP